MYVYWTYFIKMDNTYAVLPLHSGTGYEVWGNLNAPRAITVSAIIYCLRCLVAQDIPLNQA